MSGIAVIFNRDGAPVDPDAVDRMLSQIEYRGRDRRDRWIDGAVGLGHVMAHATPESTREQQPLTDDSGAFVLVLDGRIDNREELTDALSAAGVRLRDDTDAELFLQAFLQWGEEALQKIVGDFAMVLWDRRNRRLFCARDPFGIRPFYYHLGARSFIGGSELRQVLDASGIVRQPNEPMVAEYLLGSVTNREETLFTGIMRLPPAHCMAIDADNVSMRRYFDIDFGKRIRYRNDGEYAEHLLTLMTETVRVRMRAIGGIECDLSGGLDSSSVAAIAHRLLRGGIVPAIPLETVSTDFTEPESDERRYVDDVLATIGGVKANRDRVEIPTRDQREEQARRFLDVPDSPTAFIGASIRRLAQSGFRVALTGLGGDEWLDGSVYYQADLLKGLHLLALARGMRLSAAIARAEGAATVICKASSAMR
jgi:asparagine synthase (glutamine-hydrolysing)